MTRTRSQTKVHGAKKTNRYDLRAVEGFILVVHTSLGGDQLVFRYPPVARTSISEETWTAVIGRSKPTEKPTLDTSLSASSTNILGSTSSGSASKTTSSGKTNETPTDPNEPPIAISYAETYSPYNMPSVMLCNILSPKQSICDRIFHTSTCYMPFSFSPKISLLTHLVRALSSRQSSTNIVSLDFRRWYRKNWRQMKLQSQREDAKIKGMLNRLQAR